ncbi:MAG TPA: DUF3025 domain-containing protein [Pelomicrobium sp.]|nr:DUF3025 domain-containing protein [Pelomicrobium sp.]
MLAPLELLWQEEPALARGWPSLAVLNRLARRRGVVTAAGRPVTFVPPLGRRVRFEDGYEQRIFLGGAAETRAGSWHDVLNAFAWCLFPRAKAALNARHYEVLEGDRRAGGPPGAGRGRLRDALTLLDESGVVVACAEPPLADLLRERRWKALFWDQRANVARGMRFLLLGHGLMEKALAPFVGMTGHGVVVLLPGAALTLPHGELLARLDAALVATLVATTGEALRGALTPVPVLGVPDWSERAGDERFYDVTSYFRPPRAAVA